MGEGQQMILGDGSSCGIVGVGSIRLRIFDRRVRTLTDVHPISNLRGSIVSLGYWRRRTSFLEAIQGC